MADRMPKPLYVDVSRTAIRLDGPALRLSQAGRADRLVPVSRVSRAVVQGAEQGMLEALLELVHRGGAVHFQDGQGRVTAVLQPSRPSEADSARELAGIIEHHPGLGPFHWWRDAQRRHAWSLVFRRGCPGDPRGNRARLMRYLLSMCPGIPAEHEYGELHEQLHAWLQAELIRQGLQPVVGALAAQGADLTRELRDCLSLPLLWRYVRWRREQSETRERAELLRFFELQAATRLAGQLQRHIVALAAEYHASWTALRRADREDHVRNADAALD